MPLSLPPYCGPSRYPNTNTIFVRPASATTIKPKSNSQGGKSAWSRLKKFFKHHQHQHRTTEPERECQNELTKQQPTYAELDAEEVILDAGESAMLGWDEYGRWRDDWMFHELDRHNRIDMEEYHDPLNYRTNCLLEPTNCVLEPTAPYYCPIVNSA